MQKIEYLCKLSDKKVTGSCHYLIETKIKKYFLTLHYFHKRAQYLIELKNLQYVSTSLLNNDQKSPKMLETDMLQLEYQVPLHGKLPSEVGSVPLMCKLTLAIKCTDHY